MRNALLVIVVGLVVLVSGLALSLRYDLEWLRVGSSVVAIVGTGVGLMVSKRRRQRASRSDAPDSVEAIRDVNSRAAAFIDGVLLTALALVVNTLRPGIPAWSVCFVLLMAFAGAYWIRRAIAQRGARDADS